MMDSVNSQVNLQEQIHKYQHIDPPWLWIAVLISSISIHVLAVLLLFSSWSQFKPWNPEYNQNPINIEFIEVDPTQTNPPETVTQPTPPKTVTQPTESPKPAPDSLSSNTQDVGEDTNNLSVNSDVDFSQPLQKNLEKNQVTSQNNPVQPSVKPSPQPEFTPETQPEINAPPIPIPTPETTIPVNDLPWNRRQEIELGKGIPLPGSSVPESPIPTPESSPIPTPESSPIPTPEVSPTAQGVGIRVNINPILRDEVEQLRQDNKIRVGALPDFLAEYQGSPTKELELDVILGEYGLKPANLLVSLVIDQDGNFQQAVVISIEPVSLSRDKSVYEQAINQVFSQEKFTAAYNQDGSKPGLSNLYMKIKVDVIY